MRKISLLALLIILCRYCDAQNRNFHKFIPSNHISILKEGALAYKNKSCTLILGDGFSDHLRIIVNNKIIRDSIFETNYSIEVALPFMSINTKGLKDKSLILIEKIDGNSIRYTLPVVFYTGYKSVLVSRTIGNKSPPFYSVDYTNRNLIFE